MRILDWLDTRSEMLATFGDRIGLSWWNHRRIIASLPEQRPAFMVDHDGTKHYHDIDMPGGEAPEQVSSTLHKASGEVEPTKTYEYAGVQDDHLIYEEVTPL